MALVSSQKLQNPPEVEKWYVQGIHRLKVTSTGKNLVVNRLTYCQYTIHVLHISFYCCLQDDLEGSQLSPWSISVPSDVAGQNKPTQLKAAFDTVSLKTSLLELPIHLSLFFSAWWYMLMDRGQSLHKTIASHLIHAASYRACQKFFLQLIFRHWQPFSTLVPLAKEIQTRSSASQPLHGRATSRKKVVEPSQPSQTPLLFRTQVAALPQLFVDVTVTFSFVKMPVAHAKDIDGHCDLFSVNQGPRNKLRGKPLQAAE